MPDDPRDDTGTVVPMMSLVDVLALVESVVEDIDMADERVLVHRHATNDTTRAAQLRTAGDHLTDAWRATSAARVILRDLVLAVET